MYIVSGKGAAFSPFFKLGDFSIGENRGIEYYSLLCLIVEPKERRNFL
jgi:hypothetical protein